MSSNLNLYGNHRGGTSIVAGLPRAAAAAYGPDWTLADPKENRAEKLAAVVRQRFPMVRPRPVQMTAQEALPLSGDDDTLVLALDTVADTKATLATRRERQRATFQVVGRGPGGAAGTRIGLSGTLVPGDEESAFGALLLLDTLDSMTREASSRVLTATDPLTATVLRPMRDLATRQTIRHLVEKDRDPWDFSGGPLSIVLGGTAYPLVPVQGRPEDTYSHRRTLALERAAAAPLSQWAERPPLGRCAVVAVIVPERTRNPLHDRCRELHRRQAGGRSHHL